jgi:tetratricopeptide (TPR) repeat protein
MKKRLFTVIMFFAAPAFVFSSSSGTTSVFDLGTSVRAQSLGGAYTAAYGDVGAMYFNPAALNTLTRAQLEAAYIPLFFETTYSYILFGLPTVDIGTFGLSASMIKTDNIPMRDAGGVKLFDSSQAMVETIAGWGKDFFDEKTDFGASIKIDYYDLTRYSDSVSVGMDAGLLRNIINDGSQELYAGASIRNLLEPLMKLGSTGNRIPRRLDAGTSYKRQITGDISAQAFGDATVPLGAAFDYALGIEGAFYNTIFLRAGVNSYNIISAGAGIELFRMFSIDYGVFFTEIDIQHRLALKACFGEDVSQVRKDRAKLEEARIEKRAKELAVKELAELKAQLDKMAGAARDGEKFKAVHYTKGIEDYFDGDLKTALAEFDTVYTADPEYMNVRYYISMMKGLLEKANQDNYSDDVLKLYRDGVAKYLKQDYAGAKAAWEQILKVDPYNRLAVENLKEVNSLLRNIDGIKENK